MQHTCTCIAIAIIILILIYLAETNGKKHGCVEAINDLRKSIHEDLTNMKKEIRSELSKRSKQGKNAKKVTAKDVRKMRAGIIEHINAKNISGELPRIAGFVRLAFHDCVGGCDGCIDLDNEENNGLGEYIEELEDVYARFSRKLSRADFWQLAGITALVVSGTDCRSCMHPDVQFMAGRKDCAASPEYAGEMRKFPNNGGHADIDDVLGFFETTFGLPRSRPELAVALLGAHSLGRTHLNDSGFQGSWDSTQSKIDALYYQDLLNLKWTQQESKNNEGDVKFQWSGSFAGRSTNTMMLNADMCLRKVINPVDKNGHSACTLNNCRDQPETIKYVELFAVNITAWEQHFKEAYTKMTTTGYEKSQLYVPV
ncbi:unnamed protein product [Owenia fusiformis]|uniref:Uncharacterized protein n=1 Tax=Owenia fusiformis TaxID=6347 RepID=A0A8J1XSK7_OWEFU|nr:unnamed protein product [Owenia fusiformis]